nr:hypothetical protein HmN_000880900 [Hymenolepis microstoma]
MEVARWSYCYVNTSGNEYPCPKSHAMRLLWDQLGVFYCELPKPSETITDVAPSADFRSTHFAQWRKACLTSTSARVKK